MFFGINYKEIKEILQELNIKYENCKILVYN